MDCNGCIHKKICALWGNAEGQNAFCYDENCKETLKDIIGADYDLDRLRELVEADRDGRCVVLPCNAGTVLPHEGTNYEADHWNIILTAFADAPSTKSGHRIKLFSLEEASEAALKGGAYGG